MRAQFCETIFREGGFAKPRLNVFEIRRDSEFCPQGVGGNAGETQNQNTKLKFNIVPSFIISYVIQSKGKYTLGIRLGHSARATSAILGSGIF